MRWGWAIILLSMTLLLLRMTYASNTPVAVSVSGPLHVVYDWDRQKCGGWDIPDAPLRAFRDSAGGIVAFASDIRNRRFTGATFDTMKHSCRSSLVSPKMADPAQYADLRYITATWTEDGTNVHALVHAEYHADMFKTCIYSESMKCWFNAVLYARSSNAGVDFSVDNPPQVVAALPTRQDVGQGRHRGFFNPSNIIHWNGAWYMFSATIGAGGQSNGVCLFRSPDISNPDAWRTFDGASFEGRTIDPYRDPASGYRACQPLRGMPPISSVARHERSGTFIAIVQNPYKDRPYGEIAYSLSTDLVNWSLPKRLFDAPGMASKNCSDKYRYDYASLVDPTSPRRNFDQVGDSALLFMTRFLVDGCRLGPERDLVRVPVKLD